MSLAVISKIRVGSRHLVNGIELSTYHPDPIPETAAKYDEHLNNTCMYIYTTVKHMYIW